MLNDIVIYAIRKFSTASGVFAESSERGKGSGKASPTRSVDSPASETAFD
jgi:hypothetical protein